MSAQGSECVCENSIHTTLDKIWEAFTRPDITEKYWFGYRLEADWIVGSTWELKAPDGKVHAAGEVLEIDRPHRIILTWRDKVRPELAEEGYSRCVIDAEHHGGTVDLAITHSIDRIDSKLIALVATSWPKVLSSLKSFLETGEVKPAIVNRDAAKE